VVAGTGKRQGRRLWGNDRCVGHGGKRWCRHAPSRDTPNTAMRMAHALSPDTLSALWSGPTHVERSQGWCVVWLEQPFVSI
jgi:hypothetical protein